jgi:hypothetical protein
MTISNMLAYPKKENKAISKIIRDKTTMYTPYSKNNSMKDVENLSKHK